MRDQTFNVTCIMDLMVIEEMIFFYVLTELWI